MLKRDVAEHYLNAGSYGGAYKYGTFPFAKLEIGIAHLLCNLLLISVLDISEQVRILCTDQKHSCVMLFQS